MLSLEAVKALKMALNQAKDIDFLCHHSDRGLQYCSNEYIQLLEEREIKISMTESGDPRDNAVAERLNGIIKNEYLSNYIVHDLEEGKPLLDFAIRLYNEERPHMSVGNLTPEKVHQGNVIAQQLWKNYYHKNSTIVNPTQDDNSAVNYLQDH